MIGSSVVGTGAFFATRGKGAGSATPQVEDLPRTRPEATAETAPPSLLAPASPDDARKRVEAALADWRTAILIRNADMVVKLDAAFLEAPSLYMEALKSSAGSDENERVRAFSTRELGKFKRVELAATFEGLLVDKSPFVRKNAAWALGELSSGEDGRVAARHARAGLKQLVRRDPADDVRVAARTTLERIE